MSQIETPLTQLPIPAEAVEPRPGNGHHGSGSGNGPGGPNGRPPRWWSSEDVDFRRGLILGLIVSAAWLGICLAYIAGYVVGVPWPTCCPTNWRPF